MVPPYARDLIGYGRTVPHAQWPGQARIALQIVINYEEGGENCVLHGDAASEAYLQEVPGLTPLPGVRNIQVESMYEYGSRAGFWRLMRLFERYRMPVTVYGVAMALERNPEAVAALLESEHEIASHGLRWIDYQNIPEAVERAHIREALALHEKVTGAKPLGWYTGRVSPQTRRLVAEETEVLYDADSYADDLPYWEQAGAKSQLIVPYTLDNNDMKFATLHGLSTGEEFYTYLRDAFDVLYEEGEERPRMMSVGLHCRLAGRPGRLAGLRRFLDYVAGHDAVWICRRVDIARHWRAHFPAPSAPLMPKRAD
ncbi:allantoinase PuuE [Roseospira marina]|uniref:Chitooligosaccharide deacetylase n=1 Tax=Roseospira marina TaxID=140057 RepID=A0A5M6I7N2_9PROT|nr:allantoinase PuuE [Roseospira marina]KAA5604230.1 allantoinase PuuE [Roseospira marina]MBB4315624.1 putative urate catabolism protein [Roseospira marina]MBB5088620.1 putative urate catabolism protein [Roseospira marina]